MYFIFIFLPFVTAAYFLLKPTKLVFRNFLLCLASLFFYAWGEPVYLFLMLASILVNYLLALKMNKATFIFAVVFNLGFLFFFKYAGFFVQNLNSLLGFILLEKAPVFSVPELALPIGISFYTFQALSYIIDVYRKKICPQKNLLSLALYISLFPQLIAGPIVRYIDIETELNNRTESFENLIQGLRLFILGFGVKVILANNLATVADGIFSNPENLSQANTGILWIASLAYSLQIYFDFSGYSKMAIGLGKMFGFNFPQNFNYPYCACSITDFWRRWHITLSVWFRDYVYIPLGGNRVKPVRHIFNILVTWLLTGFWHGASWNFMLWGIYYGILLILEKYLFAKKLPSAIMRLGTLILVVLGWVIFRLENFTDLGFVLKHLILPNKESLGFLDYISQHAAMCSKMIFILPGIIFSFPVYPIIFKRSENSSIVYTIETIFLLLIFVVSLCLLIASTYNPFIYFRF